MVQDLWNSYSQLSQIGDQGQSGVSPLINQPTVDIDRIQIQQMQESLEKMQDKIKGLEHKNQQLKIIVWGLCKSISRSNERISLLSSRMGTVFVTSLIAFTAVIFMVFPLFSGRDQESVKVKIHKFGQGLSEFDMDDKLIEFMTKYSVGKTFEKVTLSSHADMHIVLAVGSPSRDLKDSLPLDIWKAQFKTIFEGKGSILLIVRLTNGGDVFASQGVDELNENEKYATTISQIAFDVRSSQFKEVLNGNLHQRLVELISLLDVQ
ncbi:hypothetical protein C9374_009935 [Naegleria lovaniensis]|uniref:TPM domain-containing protein n=1 Tax=Naegleria lovaniensis TaxID=51637 RepID=A0AA88GGT3_NAELO|nr:uncharacterized protein C9374_009935 [Naegleria lovaniensis]KAG2375312.1 hypothetical protein C9374_009935 [Naegleria lovaniensis]